ncbi:UDP-4-amino-4,6-dideoxy-N-acetyl-beta-L-altrosamine N-acetyltransferase [Pseudomonas sp. MS19]|uniref:UDP-4-amino-4, 6-dideoxy-N-acetyl-beta-L-altrosamine N-acetyltransferase n=1 Tax=Pseudomonas sp. MS19 TaxID=2579939 RepID=UPI001562168C|nr:UDP-4-amino-4,6-dideoxy-N-acetyl-beta-L-altrosamine N-acetyltransferase [Pseudomonas sp. MS19]NRH26812.1 UDP-4-amino-4,6-dideoxy-N-acetyl-beta-L-altrosamine N-acetyltransferase [Pseudomonas sp. MS19]
METDFGCLRDVADHEIELMRSWRNLPAVRRNMYNQHEISASEHQKWWVSIRESNVNRYFMYEYRGEPSGVIAFTNIDRISSNSTWAFYAAGDAPKGTGSRMEFLALDFAFQSLKLQKLSCEVLAYNSPVIKLHQKFGFQVEGIFRKQYLLDDDYVDVYRLGILAPEWIKIRGDMKHKLMLLNKSV